jgi:SAM-dependent methyltransferase
MSDFWNGEQGKRWVAAADRYDAQLAAYLHHIIIRSRLHADERVLDIGCGTGALTLAARRRLGPNGRVAGVDISKKMVKSAKRSLEMSGLTDVEFLRADAQTEHLGTAVFDLAISRFGVMFFDDPEMAFSNVARAVRPGGRLVFACWQSPEANPWMTIPRTATEDLIELPGLDPAAPGPFSMSGAERTLKTLGRTGWIGATATPLVGRIYVGGPGTVDEAVAFVMSTGMVATGLKGRKKKRVRKVEAALTEALAPHHDGIGVSLSAGAWLVDARR